MTIEFTLGWLILKTIFIQLNVWFTDSTQRIIFKISFVETDELF